VPENRQGGGAEPIRIARVAEHAQLWTLQGIAFASKGDSKEALAAFNKR